MNARIIQGSAITIFPCGWTIKCRQQNGACCSSRHDSHHSMHGSAELL